MPQMGQVPGPDLITFECIEQVHTSLGFACSAVLWLSVLQEAGKAEKKINTMEVQK